MAGQRGGRCGVRVDALVLSFAVVVKGILSGVYESDVVLGLCRERERERLARRGGDG